MKDETPVLHVLDVYKSYGDKLILDNIDLSVKAGELCTLVGPSGSGKSTLLRLVLGQELPTEGQLLIDGEPVGFPDPTRGIVFQRYSLFPHLTVLENVCLGANLAAGLIERRRRRREIRDEAMGYLERVRLGAHAGKYPHELSGGMQQRVAIAQSLIKKPRILLMDEPFGALDPDTREEMQVFLLELWDESRMTVFFVTHDLEEAAYLGTRILVLSQYYTDDRGAGAQRGAKLVADYRLPRLAASTEVKREAGFAELIDRIRFEGFSPDHLQHVREFNLQHPDSFQTLTSREESAWT
ncbi:MAG: ABC transporter ATP-binding protein [Chromatiaceae bacterium]|jgi:NitT/TauT family transport system ATP-binding protein|nr:ABC transporter ATP-binding protein [Chromatiaceae bacterium]